MEEHWQGLTVPESLQICLQVAAPASGSPFQGGCITQRTALNTYEEGEEGSELLGCQPGGVLCLLELTPCPSPVPSPADIRETAFVYAITAAGVSHAITQACSMGELLQCGCELTRSRAPPSPTAGPGTEGTAWEWGGCGDDVQFGYEKSQQFMDAKNKKGKNDIRALIDLHNNEAGRLVRPLHSLSPAPLVPLSGPPPSVSPSHVPAPALAEIWPNIFWVSFAGPLETPQATLHPQPPPPRARAAPRGRVLAGGAGQREREPRAEHGCLFLRRCAAT